MSLLQNKLVWNSIEALHEEAAAAIISGSQKKIIIKSRSAATLQTADVNIQDQSENVMIRINNLMQQLSDDDPNPSKPSADSDSFNSSLVDANDAHNNVNNQLVENSPAEEPQTAYKTTVASNTLKKSADEGFLIKGKSNSNVLHTPNITNEPNNSLASIADAIDQASQNPTEPKPFVESGAAALQIDVHVLTATLVDELRSTMSTMIATELPYVVKKAVSDAFQDFPAISKSYVKKAATKKAATKKNSASK